MREDTKSLIFIGDGMGGRPIAALNGRTTVEAAETPAMDRIAREGGCGLMDPIAPGKPAGSDTSHMAILGYEPHRYYRGRGPFEAKGVGIDVEVGDVAFRCNFATVEGRTVVDRRAGRIKEGTDALAGAIQEGIPKIEDVRIIFEPSVEHRAALVLRGPGLSHEVTEVDPHDPGLEYFESHPQEDVEDRAGAEKAARILNDFVSRTREILQDHPINQERREEGKLPANIILPRGAGTAVKLEPLSKRYGLSAAMIVEVDLVRGLGEYLQMDVIHVDGATGGQDTDEMAIAQAVVDALDDHDFVLANIKCPDLGGHDGDCEAKMEAITKVDRAMGHVLDNVDWDRTTIMITADHCTPCSVQDHSGDAVPMAFFGHGTRPDDVERFGERPCGKGIMGRLRGMEIMDVLTNMMDRAGKFGA
ncbi:MAG: 2,3-bisphosphoglycerate-independent phosphoglycerate mutase [Armatimonadota bacterium]|nr:2,3-bisphosphoglycerate-independent phosphoglycerate mutase [Armatimonadota bacterium]